MQRARFLLVSAVFAIAAGCGPAQPMHGPTMNNRMGSAPQRSRVVSTEILQRDPRANRTKVKHILIGWKDLADSYGGGMDPRAAARSKGDAEREVESLMGQLRGGADFDTLMQAHSEDSGLAANPDGYEVRPDANLVLEFRALGLRLDVGEVGVTETQFGFHVMKRTE